MTSFGLEDLDSVIAERSTSEATKSYTKFLLDGGTERAAKKFGEEAVEAVIAAMQGDKSALAAEAADVLFHLLVLLRAGGVTLAEVMSILNSRTAQSGLAEKAARKS
jgi:phosphoribosyl-ATP pyrophosphohydrolase